MCARKAEPCVSANSALRCTLALASAAGRLAQWSHKTSRIRVTRNKIRTAMKQFRNQIESHGKWQEVEECA
jgi:ribosomal protein S20